MKRALLIATGTVGGLGVVLSITPPQIGASSALIAGASATTSDSNSNLNTGASTGTQDSVTPSATPSKSVTKNSKSNNSTSSSATNGAIATDSAANSQATPAAPTGLNGSFTGDSVNIGYGNVQVQITVSNGKITDAVALQAPSGRSQRFTDYAVPNLRSQTLQVQSAAISGVSGASYTSYGWYKSLISALQKAGMTTGV